MKQLGLLLIVFSLVMGFAQESDGFVQEDAHVHGVASLNIAQEGQTLFIEFMSPAINLIGFEYQPSSDEDKDLVKTTLASLAQPLELFSAPSAAQCQVLSADVSSDFRIESEADDDPEDHSEHEDHAEDSAGPNVKHACNHMLEGPLKSLIALPGSGGNLYRADGTHTRFDTQLSDFQAAKGGFFSYYAAAAGDYIFYLNQSDVRMIDSTGGMMVRAEQELTTEALTDCEAMKLAYVFSLQEGENILMISGASEANLSMVIESLGHEHGHAESHNHDQAAHDHEDHVHEDQDEASHVHAEHDHEEEMHSEFRASYELSCEQPDMLSELDLTGLFGLYPGIEDLDVQYVIEQGQGSAELNALNTKLNF